MKYFLAVLLFSFFTEALYTEQRADEPVWLRAELDICQIHYQEPDLDFIQDYTLLITQALEKVGDFFNRPFAEDFHIYIHPDRHSLDSAWQTDWAAPGFHSECWMVASGTAKKMDLLSPGRWKEEACEHVFEERDKTRNLITHELIHVFHGQENVSPDFNEVYGIDWFVEGLAVYASGQCGEERMEAVRKAVLAGQVPVGLDQFWKGDLRYGLSGSMVSFIDETYGRSTTMKLLKYNRKSDILQELACSESDLIEQWKSQLMRAQ